MNYSYLFTKNDGICFDILSTINTRTSTSVTKRELCDQFDLTNYQLRKFYNTINADLLTVCANEPAYLDEVDSGTWKAYNVDTYLIQKMALLYLNRSPLYVALEYKFFYDNLYTQKEYVSANYMSTSVFYRASEGLEKLLKKHHFYAPTTMLTNHEFTIRLHLFQLYYTLYNTVEAPFQDLSNLVHELILTISDHISIQLKPTQVTKLSIFLRIWLLRVNNKQVVDQMLLPQIVPDDDGKALFDELKQQLSNKFELNEYEFNYVYSFLLTQGYLGADIQSTAATSTPLVVQLSNDFIHHLLNQNVLVTTSLINSAELWARILNIHLQFTTFFIEPTTFIDPDQINFFAELYPAFDVSIENTIADLKTRSDLALDQHMIVNLYFSYMFALINSVPAELMKDQVHICVDFSQGTLYTDYVIESLASFNHANLLIDDLVTPETDIYISDFHSTSIHQRQVIWQDPPTSTDWSKLADIILDIKRIKLNGFSSNTSFETKESEQSETD